MPATKPLNERLDNTEEALAAIAVCFAKFSQEPGTPFYDNCQYGVQTAKNRYVAHEMGEPGNWEFRQWYAYRQPATLRDFDVPGEFAPDVLFNPAAAIKLFNDAFTDYKADRAVACNNQHGRYTFHHTRAWMLAAIYDKLNGSFPVAPH